MGATDKMNEYVTHIGSGLLLALVEWRREVTLGRNYWNPKSIILLFACFFLLIFPVGAKENLSPYL